MMTVNGDALDRISRMGRECGLRIAVVESLTSGSLAHTVGAGASASEWFAGGIVARMTDVKTHLLGVDVAVDPCSGEYAYQLAVGGCEMFAADVCVSTTGIGGVRTHGGHESSAVYLGWAVEHSGGYECLQLAGRPADVISQAVAAAVEMIAAHSADVCATLAPARLTLARA